VQAVYRSVRIKHDLEILVEAARFAILSDHPYDNSLCWMGIYVEQPAGRFVK
jgi:hypothetical protein